MTTSKLERVLVTAGLLLALVAPVLCGCSSPQHHKASRDSCSGIITRLQAAKETWAIENQKPDTAIPSEADIFGENKYIRVPPKCPAGGVYSLRAVREKVRCSVASHNID